MAPVDNTTRKRKKIYLRKYISSEEDDTTFDEGNEHWEAMSSPSEQFFGEFHSSVSHGEFHSQRQLDETSDEEDERRLQISMDSVNVNLDFCVGRYIGVQYSITMMYRLRNSEITLEEVLNEPFSTAEYRDIYLNEWLKADDPIGAFDNVRCAGQPRRFTDAPSVAPSKKEEPTTEPVSHVCFQRGYDLLIFSYSPLSLSLLFNFA